MKQSLAVSPNEHIEIAIDKLRPYPRQAEVFGDISEAELQSLAEDIAEKGLLHPIHILPDFTILAGHQRVRAMRLLRKSTIPAILRHDLAGNPSMIADFFISENLSRRHLGWFGIARCYVELRDAARAGPIATQGKKIESLRAATVSRLAAMGNPISIRTLSRYVELIQLPRGIQDAIADKRLTMRDGRSLLKRSPAELQRIASECAKGKTKRQLQEVIHNKPGPPRGFADSDFSKAVGVLAAFGTLHSRLSEISSRYAGDDWMITRLKQANKTIIKILKKVYV